MDWIKQKSKVLKRTFAVFPAAVILPVCLLMVSPGLPQTVHLAYTANLNANLEACDCGGEEIGGMLRLANAVDSLRRQNPGLVLLDTGDFLNTYLLTKADSLMWRFMQQLRFTAVGVGDQEFVEGKDFLEQRTGPEALPLVNCNITDRKSGRLLFKPFKIAERNGLRIGITGVVPPQAFSFIAAPAVRILPVKQSLQKVMRELTEKTDLVVLLFHGSYREAAGIGEQFPGIRLVIAGHSQEKFSRQQPRQIVVQPGVDGEYLGLLTATRSGNRWRLKNDFLPVTPRFGENASFKKAVENYFRELKAGQP